jgi:hypothetical protein
VRLFNPEWALLLPAGVTPTTQQRDDVEILVTTFPALDPALAGLLNDPPKGEQLGLQRYRPAGGFPPPSIRPPSPVGFDNGLELIGAAWPEGMPEPGDESTLWLTWHVAQPLDLPPIPIVANPPPAGEYIGPRLEVFTHLLDADGRFIAGDDALWVDPVTLLRGDRFLQIHRLTLPLNAPVGPYTLEVGLYDPKTNERRSILDADGQPTVDYVLLPVEGTGS